MRNKKPVTGSSYTEAASEDRQYHPCIDVTY
nr:MAG TPA: nuclease [Caudoviricetes sp.]